MTDEKLNYIRLEVPKMADKLADAIYYLVNKLSIESRTKLIKLLYLADSLAKKKLGKTITGVKYVYHYYGPYSHDIILKAIDMSTNGEIIEVFDPVKNRYIYRKGVKSRNLELNPKEVEILDEIIENFGKLSIQEIKNRAYDTDEMKRSKPGDIVLE